MTGGLQLPRYHPGLKKWIEIGNSGVFRPEMLLPMGLPEDVPLRKLWMDSCFIYE